MRTSPATRSTWTELVELSAELGEVKTVHRNLGSVSGLRDAKVLAVQGDQVQTELSPLFLALVFEDDVKAAGFLLCTQDDLVFVAG